MAGLTIPNPTYATQGPTKTGQVFAANELTALENAIVGRVTITLDGATKTGTINFIDGTQTIFSDGKARAYPNQGLSNVVAPVSVTANIVAGTSTADLEAISINTGTPTTIGFPFYLTAAGTNGQTITVQFTAYKA